MVTSITPLKEVLATHQKPEANHTHYAASVGEGKLKSPETKNQTLMWGNRLGGVIRYSHNR